MVVGEVLDAVPAVADTAESGPSVVVPGAVGVAGGRAQEARFSFDRYVRLIRDNYTEYLQPA